MLTARDVADRLGLKEHPRSWRGDCPTCAYPRAFSVLNGKGDRLRLYCANGCGRDALDDAMTRVMGGNWLPPERYDADEARVRARKQASAVLLWNGSEPACGTLADRYLAVRGLAGLAASAALRFRRHPEGGRLPALVALVQDAAGAQIAAHRTYLAAMAGAKADLSPAKATLGPVWGGAIRLDPAAPELAVGEGIESAAAAGRILGLPAWAAVSVANLARGLVLPANVRAVVIAADNDPVGRGAAGAARHRWTAEGRAVRIATPEGERRDFNDLLCERVAAPEAADG